MSATGETIRSGRATAVMAFGLMASLAPLATFAAVLPEITRAWGLSASQAGWIGGIYFGGYAAAGSFLIAGAADAAFGWRATFTISGIAPLLAIAAIALLPPAAQASPAPPFVLDFRPVLRNRALMAYVLAFAGNIWEVSAVRAWFVAYLAWTLHRPHHFLLLPNGSFWGPAVISGLASLAGFPVSIAVAELALRRGKRAIIATCFVSVAILLGLAATAGGPPLVILPLLVLAQVASMF